MFNYPHWYRVTCRVICHHSLARFGCNIGPCSSSRKQWLETTQALLIWGRATLTSCCWVKGAFVYVNLVIGLVGHVSFDSTLRQGDLVASWELPSQRAQQSVKALKCHRISRDNISLEPLTRKAISPMKSLLLQQITKPDKAEHKLFGLSVWSRGVKQGEEEE